MAQQTINIGASPNDGTGTPLRTAFQYTNSNFSELYTAVGPSGNNIVVPGSATITGDLTVDTNVLKVDTTNNRVGIGTASPSQVLSIQGPANQAFLIADDSTATYRAIYGVDSVTGGGVLGCISNHPVIFRVNNTEQMRLNSTGLGVGGSPTSKLSIFAGADGDVGFFRGGSTRQLQIGTSATAGYLNSDNGSAGFELRVNGTARAYFDTSGNVGIGVTPSAWGSAFKVVQLRSGSLMADSGGSTLYNVQNVYFDGSNWLRINAAASTRYEQSTGVHSWWNAPTGTVGTAASFTQAMTLDASGNLLCGSTALNATWNTRLTLSSDSGTTRWAVGPYSTATNFVISAASGGGVYLNGTAATSWTSASDERLKDIIEPISNAIAKVGSLRAVIGKFKSDDTNTRKSFLMAQDVQSVLPEAVDASNPDRLGLAYTDVIPLLVAAIKELTARVQTLETR